MTEVSAISTICKNCLFAKYENNTQVGCQFDRTDTVDNHPVYELLAAHDDDNGRPRCATTTVLGINNNNNTIKRIASAHSMINIHLVGQQTKPSPKMAGTSQST